MTSPAVTTAHDRTPVGHSDLARIVAEIVAATPILDMHTHLFAPAFGPLGLWGIDRLLTYHYLEAELFRISTVRPEAYWSMDLSQRADLIWRTLFVDRAPLSEATRGVVAALHALGLDPAASTLEPARAFYAARTAEAHLTHVLALAGVTEVVMTNDPLDPAEVPVWKGDAPRDRRFHAALRLDRVLNDWASHWQVLASQGYDVDANFGGASAASLRRFLDDWAAVMHPAYLAVSLPDSFVFPDTDLRTEVLSQAVLPFCRDAGIPLSLMIGVRRQINPRLRLAGDGSGRADLRALGSLCEDWPDVRFLVSVLAYENQHELAVYARKFGNLRPFGCWWFLNTGSVVQAITRMRLELLGPTFIPQHSDSRVLEQLIYKWAATRTMLTTVLTDAFGALIASGRPVSRADIQGESSALLRGNFEEWMAR